MASRRATLVAAVFAAGVALAPRAGLADPGGVGAGLESGSGGLAEIDPGRPAVDLEPALAGEGAAPDDPLGVDASRDPIDPGLVDPAFDSGVPGGGDPDFDPDLPGPAD